MKGFSVTNPTLFNKASVVSYYDLDISETLYVDWTTSGLYQLVVYSEYFNAIGSISDVFTVDKWDPPTIYVNQSLWYPGQNITSIMSFTCDNIIGPGLLTIGIINSTLNAEKLRVEGSGTGFHEKLRVEGSGSGFHDYTTFYEVTWHLFDWNSASAITDFSLPNVNFMVGSYKIAVFAVLSEADGRTIYLCESNVFQQGLPILTLHALEKRQYFQGEPVTFNIYNPYITMVDCNNCESDYYIHKFVIVSTLYPYIEFEKIYDTTNSSTSTIIVPYNVGSYKIILKRFIYTSGYHEMVEKFIHAWDVTNSTFTVAPNLAIVTTNINCPYEYSDDHLIEISLRTQNNIPLFGPYTFDIVEETMELGEVFYSKTINMNEQSKTMDTSNRDTTVLNTTLLVQRHKISYGSRVRVVIDYNI
jgi:hypothetical protein